MAESNYEKASTVLSKAELCRNSLEAETYWKSAISLAEEGLKNDTDSSKYNYLLGCIFYSKGLQQNRVYPEVEKYLSQYLRLKPGHEFSLCLLGFHLFDRHLYQQALGYLEMVNPDYFSDLDQEWRRLKILELRLSCRLYLNPESVVFSDIKKVADEYRRFPDRTTVPMPLEITLSLERLIADKGHLVALDQMLQEVFSMLITTDQAALVARHATWVRLRLGTREHQRA